MSKIPHCKTCEGTYVYEDGSMYICPECHAEWSIYQDELDAEAAEEKAEESAILDAHGTPLSEGDDATMVKDVRIGRSSDVLKRGTRVQNVQFEENGPHNIVARVDGFGMMELKSELIQRTNK